MQRGPVASVLIPSFFVRLYGDSEYLKVGTVLPLGVLRLAQWLGFRFLTLGPGFEPQASQMSGFLAVSRYLTQEIHWTGVGAAPGGPSRD